MSRVLLIAMRIADDAGDVSTPVRALLKAFGDPDAPNAHVTALDVEEINQRQRDELADLMTRGQPEKFRTLD